MLHVDMGIYEQAQPETRDFSQSRSLTRLYQMAFLKFLLLQLLFLESCPQAYHSEAQVSNFKMNDWSSSIQTQKQSDTPANNEPHF